MYIDGLETLASTFVINSGFCMHPCRASRPGEDRHFSPPVIFLRSSDETLACHDAHTNLVVPDYLTFLYISVWYLPDIVL